jgi:hypothetical protein
MRQSTRCGVISSENEIRSTAKMMTYFRLCSAFLSACILLGGCNATMPSDAMTKPAEDVGLTIDFPQWNDGDGGKQEIVLTFSNRTNRAREVVLPYALEKGGGLATSGLDKPSLVLFTNLPSMQGSRTEGFALCDEPAGTMRVQKTVLLKPNETIQISYPVDSFYRIGSCGLVFINFTECLYRGNQEVEIKALVAHWKNGAELEAPLLSSPVTLKCDFLKDKGKEMFTP